MPQTPNDKWKVGHAYVPGSAPIPGFGYIQGPFVIIEKQDGKLIAAEFGTISGSKTTRPFSNVYSPHEQWLPVIEIGPSKFKDCGHWDDLWPGQEFKVRDNMKPLPPKENSNGADVE